MKLLLFFFLTFSLTAQVKGVVVDEKNQPIPYVSVWVEHENTGTSTEEDGSFEIEVKDKNINLIFLPLSRCILVPTKKQRLVLSRREVRSCLLQAWPIFLCEKSLLEQ